MVVEVSESELKQEPKHQQAHDSGNLDTRRCGLVLIWTRNEAILNEVGVQVGRSCPRKFG